MVTFSELWSNHPTNQGEQYPCRILGIGNFDKQCAIRMGVCLKRCGVTAGEIRGAITCNQAKLTNGDDMHFIRTKEVANALRRTSIPGAGPVYSLIKPIILPKSRTAIGAAIGVWGVDAVARPLLPARRSCR